MAKVVGAKLGRPITINEYPHEYPWRSHFSNTIHVQSTPSADLATESFVPGAISVQVTVHAMFELE